MKSYPQGFYLFGGIDQHGTMHNDLWLIQPDYSFNSKMMSR